MAWQPCIAFHNPGWHAHTTPQGMLYDLIIENKDGPPNKHSRIIPARGWNHLLAPWEYPEHDTIVSHVPHPPQPEDADKKCKDEPASRPCKYKGVRYFWDRVRAARGQECWTASFAEDALGARSPLGLR